MNIVATNLTVADYCQAMQRGEIIVNRDYQRSDQVWPPAARSFLIETILLGLPMPKFSLYQVTDLKSRKTIKEIVDGQQRSTAIRDFSEDRLRLSPSLDTEEVAGKTYTELEDSYKSRFLDYQLSADLFVAATPEEVRDVFRRMNSYTIPLNPEEQRHATFQGKFKWFIHRLSKRCDESFLRMGTFGEKQLIRMADTKLLTEICHALLYGIQTTNKKKLDDLYETKERELPEEAELQTRIGQAIDELTKWTPLHGGTLMKPHIMYSLLLAMTHTRRPVGALESVYHSKPIKKYEVEIVLANLTALGEAVDAASETGKFGDFVKACSSKTNVREQRELRLSWLCRALAPEVF